MRDVFASEKDCLIESGRAGNWNRYAEVMRESVFALAPGVYGITSFRLYEAMAFGCIPVYISDEFTTPYPSVPWEEFSLGCLPKELQDLPLTLKGMSQYWRDKAFQLLIDFYPAYFTLKATSQQIANILEKL